MTKFTQSPSRRLALTCKTLFLSSCLVSACGVSAQQQPVVPASSSPGTQVMEPCKVWIGGPKIALVTKSGGKCMAGAPLFMTGLNLEAVIQQICDFNKAINQTHTTSYLEVDTAMCAFNGNPLPGTRNVIYGRMEGNRVIEIKD